MGYGSDDIVAELMLSVYADSDAAVLDITSRLLREFERFEPTGTEIESTSDDDTYEIALSFVRVATGVSIAADLRGVVLPLLDRLGFGPECFELDGSGLATVGYMVSDFTWTTALHPACYRARLGAWRGDATRFEAVPLIPEYPDPPLTDEDLRQMVELLKELMPPVVLVMVELVVEVAGFDVTDARAYVRTGLAGYGDEATITTTAQPDGPVRVEVGLCSWRADALEMVDDLRRVLDIPDWTLLQDHGDRVDVSWRASRVIARGMTVVEASAAVDQSR